MLRRAARPGDVVTRWPAVVGGAGLMVLALPLGIVLLLSPASSAGACSVDAPAVDGKWTAGQIGELWVSQGGPADQAETAGAVGMAESGGDPNAVGPPTRWGVAIGLMQILGAVLPGDLRDPAVNMRNAVKKYEDAHGWTPWEAWSNGSYLRYMGGGSPAPVDCGGDLGGGTELPSGGQWLAALPGMPGEQCDARIIPDVEALIRRYHVTVTDCYAAVGHAAGGEHPLGLATDLVPGAGGSWDDVDRLAHDAGWIRSCGASGVRPACPLKPWLRFVGWDGYPGHGRGDHLHLSWQHGPGRPASTVTVFSTEGTA
jgi:hypothetical protein